MSRKTWRVKFRSQIIFFIEKNQDFKQNLLYLLCCLKKKVREIISLNDQIDINIKRNKTTEQPPLFLSNYYCFGDKIIRECQMCRYFVTEYYVWYYFCFTFIIIIIVYIFYVFLYFLFFSHFNIRLFIHKKCHDHVIITTMQWH